MTDVSRLPIRRLTGRIQRVEAVQALQGHNPEQSLGIGLHLAEFIPVTQLAMHRPATQTQGSLLTIPEAQTVHTGIITGLRTNPHRVARLPSGIQVSIHLGLRTPSQFDIWLQGGRRILPGSIACPLDVDDKMINKALSNPGLDIDALIQGM